jgi:hypothetical protein
MKTINYPTKCFDRHGKRWPARLEIGGCIFIHEGWGIYKLVIG